MSPKQGKPWRVNTFHVPVGVPPLTPEEVATIRAIHGENI
jgi:hypothetical protein